ncbi:hypothetical protein CCU68_11245 [Pseudomonas gingeri NCPPB 3146 = LMG 5327]|uniref:Lipoprotein n=2 Tax=Pseudomonas gingeri TaxID=117681 RepID=A0A7Y8CE34_9PSED|nr:MULTISPECIES: hypothetical protein [Pseudomonas]NVZ26410.1 hypothetical protein [Pseudomonas gingeri]NWA10747.1 hypothetical protein [Pseudomonas gingeri]NWC14606.1 hypothetical protein [Pseudomonas gingeri]NWE48043.1 hypothetical protein [Pseudomonas gingeri]NWE68787.1 hypothetical protein [Pseudomonas gingeri]
MVRPLMLLILAGVLGGCAGKPGAGATSEAAPAAGKGCDQADWQAETAPVLNKRLGPDGLEKYDTSSGTREQGCP